MYLGGAIISKTGVGDALFFIQSSYCYSLGKLNENSRLKNLAFILNSGVSKAQTKAEALRVEFTHVCLTAYL